VNARRTREGNEIAFVRAWTARAPLARVIEATRLERTPELHPLIRRISELAQSGARSECVMHELTLRAAGANTEVRRDVRVSAPRLLLGFVALTAERAHDVRVERVVAWAERG
jgi:hypothetical protein